MKLTYTPIFSINAEIISLLQKISYMEGELASLRRNLKIDLDIQSITNIDAVHFSTKLEGNKLSIKQVTDILNSKINFKTTRDVKEIVNYSKARIVLNKKRLTKQKLSVELILEIHKILQNSIVTGKLKGFFRNAQNVIKDSKTGSIVYLPPEPKDVNKLMNELIYWVNRSILEKSTSALIVSAIFHYQFVTIHPFIDGNGRVARLITNYILSNNGYTVLDYAAIEKQHEQNRAMYYNQLHDLQGFNFYDIKQDADISSWIIYWLVCLEKTYTEALQRISSVAVSYISPVNSNARLEKAISLFKKHQALKAADYSIIMGLGRTQAVEDLNILVEQGIIEKTGKGKNTLYRVKH